MKYTKNATQIQVQNAEKEFWVHPSSKKIVQSNPHMEIEKKFAFQ